MKPAAFRYHVATSTAEVVALLAEHGEGGRILAGGQSLVPLMNFRLAQPDDVIDINRVAELDFIREEGGRIVVGALARQAAVERSAAVRRRVPLLAAALAWVAHPPIRHRGTVVGSIAHADPAAELPAVALALDAEVTLLGPDGARTLAAGDFFVGPFDTALRQGEFVTQVAFPFSAEGSGFGFAEFARRHGDFAIAGAAVTVTLDGGRVADSRVVLCGVGPRPLRAPAAEERLRGALPDTALIVEAAEAALQGVTPSGDIHGGSEYRIQVARVQVREAITAAVDRARGAR